MKKQIHIETNEIMNHDLLKLLTTENNVKNTFVMANRLYGMKKKQKNMKKGKRNEIH